MTAHFGIAVLLLLIGAPGQATEPKNCFDFTTQVATALHEAPLKSGQDSRESLRLPEGVDAAAVRGEVQMPVLRLLQLLLNHETLKDPQVTEQTVEKVKTPLYLAYDRVKNVVKPFPFVQLRWTEDWAYAVVEGTAQDPRTVVISYQKSEGTGYIQHFCGNIVLRSTGSHSTDMSQYEEARISGQGTKDRLDGLNDILVKMRKR